jgi:uncharacterized protein (TIGR00661 family)
MILSFTREKPLSKKTLIVSPILREEIIRLKRKKIEEKDKILVYLSKQSSSDFIDTLKNIPENFVIYGYNKNLREKNIEYKKAGPQFLKDLSECKAIIASAGFTLMSEALYLKKPYFAVPLKKQFEQILNAIYLKNSKMGDFSENPDENQLKDFIKNLKIYKKTLDNYQTNPDEAKEVLDRLLKEL